MSNPPTTIFGPKDCPACGLPHSVGIPCPRAVDLERHALIASEEEMLRAVARLVQGALMGAGEGVTINLYEVAGPGWTFRRHQTVPVPADLVCEPGKAMEARRWLMGAYRQVAEKLMPPKREPSHHDLHITTRTIPRTKITDLPYSIRVQCTRSGGWEVWERYRGEERQIAAEYAIGGPQGLILDVAGHVILDTLTPLGVADLDETTAPAA